MKIGFPDNFVKKIGFSRTSPQKEKGFQINIAIPRKIWMPAPRARSGDAVTLRRESSRSQSATPRHVLVRKAGASRRNIDKFIKKIKETLFSKDFWFLGAAPARNVPRHLRKEDWVSRVI